MTLRINRIQISLIAGALAAAALGACKKGSEYASSDTSAMKVDSAGGRTDTTAATSVRTDSGTPPGKFADASVLGYATVANTGEIAMGKLGEHMATNPSVKSFARMLVTDHQKLLSSDKQLTSKLATSADTTAGDAMDLRNHDADEIKDLNGKTKGADWDKEFINQIIDGHQKILSQFQDAAKNSPSASVRSELEKASGVIQQHLTKAQDIKTNVLKD
jgi:putative membrane protein